MGYICDMNMKRILYILALVLSMVACTEEIDKSNRYTFTGETVADYLLNRSDSYSHFINLLKKAELFSLLNTYGQFTLFLPDNEAVEKYVQEQDSIYWATKETDKPIYTGITSPLVEELSDSMANVIARMHLIEENYHTAEFGEGAIAKWNFYDRALVVSYKTIDERFYIMINNDAAIIDGDNQVENGIIHHINRPIDVKPSYLAAHIEKYSFFRLFNQAIAETNFGDNISEDIDYSYAVDKDNIDYNWFPKKKYIKYTAFIEPDEVFHKRGIYTIDDLKAFAEKWYGSEDKDNPRSPKNALYKFVAYHFIDGEVPYNRIVPSRSGSENFDVIYVPGHDLYNYFTTLQGKLMKVLKPLSTANGQNIYINYSKRATPYNFEMRNHLNVRVIELTEFTQMDEQYADFVPNTTNGLIHPIDKILIYNEDEMVGNILNERMRFDIATMQPELSSNNIWQQEESMMIPDGYCKGFKRHGTEIRWGYQSGTEYNCDQLYFVNQYDWAIKLPPVPTRTYEIRFSVVMFREDEEGYQVSGENLCQLYFDGKVCGLPLNLSVATKSERIGWQDDYMTLDNGLENDKLLRNKGWMKAPDVYNSWYLDYMPARHNFRSMRKIATIQYLVEGEHWLRFRNLVEHVTMPGTTGSIYIFLDYIEIVPLHIVSDPTNPEDRH